MSNHIVFIVVRGWVGYFFVYYFMALGGPGPLFPSFLEEFHSLIFLNLSLILVNICAGYNIKDYPLLAY